jgi:hypothetical protein
MIERTNTDSPEPQMRWPWASIVVFGTFGHLDTAGRRYQQQSAIAFSLAIVGFIAWAVLGTLVREPWVSSLPGLIFTATWAYVSVQAWKYISSLDEMSRSLQLEAMSITYLIGVPVFLFTFFFYRTTGWSWQHLPLIYFALELVRGIVLALRVRRYA